MNNYTPGQIVEGKVTAIQPYGAFVALDHNTSGLIHISEISDGYVKDINRYLRVGESVKVKIIDYNPVERHARLSLKAARKGRTHHKYQTNKQRPLLPAGRIGFQSVAAHMDQWIEEAKKNIL